MSNYDDEVHSATIAAGTTFGALSFLVDWVIEEEYDAESRLYIVADLQTLQYAAGDTLDEARNAYVKLLGEYMHELRRYAGADDEAVSNFGLRSLEILRGVLKGSGA